MRRSFDWLHELARSSAVGPSTEFLLTVKAPRALTHAKRLYGPEPWLARIRQGLSILGPKRGVLLVQLPPSAAVDHARLAFFLERVPEGLRVCIEFRNETGSKTAHSACWRNTKRRTAS